MHTYIYFTPEDVDYNWKGVGKDVSEGDVKRADDGPSVVGGTQLGNIFGLMTVRPS